MPGTLSFSSQKALFKEFLKFIEKGEQTDIEKGKQEDSFILAIDSLCKEITRQQFRDADETNAFDLLSKMAVGLHSKDEFVRTFSKKPFARHYSQNENGNNLRDAYWSFFDFIDTQYTEKSFARYMVGRYRLGYEFLALYWASVLFEQIIERKVKIFDKAAFIAKKEADENKRDPSLDDSIKMLSNTTLEQDSIYIFDDVFTHYYEKNQEKKSKMAPRNTAENCAERLLQTKERLLNFKKLRNDIAHYLMKRESMLGTRTDLIYYVWSELLPESFQYYMDKHTQNFEEYPTIISAIGEIEADYMVKAIDETTKIDPKPKNYINILKNDFQDLFEIRRKLLPLRAYLKNWLQRKHAKSGLTTDIVTPIDTTSAYIWVPLVKYDFQIAQQAGVYNCAVSILVTPLDFRVYMDFGGYAVVERAAYYRFLGSPEYHTSMEPFENSGEIEIFDIDWFCFIAERAHLGAIRDIVNTDRIKLAEKKLAKHASNPPITWNRMLHGYILKRENVPDEGITLKWVKKRLEWVIQFYQEFNKFCDNNEKDK